MPKIDMEYLLCCVIEYSDYRFEYYRSSKRYYKKHGYGVRLDNPKTDEERHICYFSKWSNSASDVVYAMRDLFKMDSDMFDRLWSAARAMKKWCVKTNWERCLPDELKDRLKEYVFGKEEKPSWCYGYCPYAV